LSVASGAGTVALMPSEHTSRHPTGAIDERTWRREGLVARNHHSLGTASKGSAFRDSQ